MEKKVALVTGASRGIGRRIAAEFASSGFSVALNYKENSEAAKTALGEIERSGGSGALFKCDVTDHGAVIEMIEAIIARFGKIDVLVNNAGITKNRGILKMTKEEWDSVINTDLNGPFYVLKECARHMASAKNGSIINISSITAYRGVLGASNYAAAKAGLTALTKSAAMEFGRHNIRVNAVLPGFHNTDMGQKASKVYVEKALQDSVLSLTTDISELSSFVLFLSGMKTVSGQVFSWDSRII